ncbi:MAG TPA: hypothetical protein VLE23_18895 [Geminicoccaceae bacterium]|nr:hypothetical protein [Geminicoccaceae bacterium]
MAHALQSFWGRVPADAFLRLVDAALRARFAARRRERENGHHRAAALDPATMRDIGAARGYQDYAASADLSAGSDRRLHRIADGGRWASPR